MTGSVLLIEDEPHIIEAVSFILERDGWTVSAHSDGETAVERALTLDPEVIILDAMLPGRTGFEILKDLRGHPKMANRPVLMLTAKGQAKDREAAGASRFMTKPFANAEVLDAVRSLAG